MKIAEIMFMAGYGLYVLAMGIIVLQGLCKKDYRDQKSGSHVPPSKAGTLPKNRKLLK